MREEGVLGVMLPWIDRLRSGDAGRLILGSTWGCSEDIPITGELLRSCGRRVASSSSGMLSDTSLLLPIDEVRECENISGLADLGITSSTGLRNWRCGEPLGLAGLCGAPKIDCEELMPGRD